MKKIYLTASVALIGMIANAQTTLKIANPAKNKAVRTERVANPNSVQAVTSTIVCNTQYVAGTTMDLNFTYTTTNTDQEYVDSLAITFPAGITPTGLGATSNPFPNTEDNGGGLEALNGVTGQTITWGSDTATDQYGGIFSAAGITFTVNVTVDPTATANLTANYFMSGDGFGATPANGSGLFVIYPVGAALKNLQTVFVQPLNLTALNVCNYGMDTLIAKIKNLGTVADSNTAVMFSVNGTVIGTTVLPTPLAAGDSIFVPCLSAFNFAPSNTYVLQAWTSVSGDIDATNDTATLAFTNSISTALSTTAYTNGIESAYDYASLTRAFVSGAGFVFGPSTATKHTGLQALFYTVAANTAPLGVNEAMVILPCMDVTMGETYRISYWKRSNTTGQSAILTGLTNDVAGMSTVVKAYAAITPTSVWIKDSADFTATATETRYFAIGGKGTTTATVGINVRLDDINIVNIASLVGVKNVATATSGLYPNPAANTVTLTNVTVGEVVNVYNVLGSVVLTEKVSATTHAMNIATLANGNYIVRVGNTTPVRLTVAK
jgi:hypothetical protein